MNTEHDHTYIVGIVDIANVKGISICVLASAASTCQGFSIGV